MGFSVLLSRLDLCGRWVSFVCCVGFEMVVEMEMKTEGGRLLCSSCFVGDTWGVSILVLSSL